MVPTAGALHVLVEVSADAKQHLMLLRWPQAVLPAKMLLTCSAAWRGLQGRVACRAGCPAPRGSPGLHPSCTRARICSDTSLFCEELPEVFWS